jgi:hypothetical protein
MAGEIPAFTRFRWRREQVRAGTRERRHQYPDVVSFPDSAPCKPICSVREKKRSTFVVETESTPEEIRARLSSMLAR